MVQLLHEQMERKLEENTFWRIHSRWVKENKRLRNRK